MPNENLPPVTTRYRSALTFAAVVAVVATLVLAYKLTTPKSSQTTTTSGEQVTEGDVLHVGALPVT